MYGLPSFGTTFIEKKLLLQKTFTKFSGTIGKMILKKKRQWKGPLAGGASATEVLNFRIILKMLKYQQNNFHCANSVHTRSYSDPHFPAFGLNTARYSEYGHFLRSVSVG